MKKISFTLFAILLYQIIPLLGASALLLHWKMLAIILTAAAIWLSQPAVRQEDVTAHQSADRNTVLLILIMAGVSTVVPEMEWAYWRKDPAGDFFWNALGGMLMLVGTTYRIWAIYTLGKHFTATVQTADTQTLITSGPYRRLRHPSYLGAFVAVLGCGVLLQAWVGVGVAVCAMGYAYFKRITVEELALSTHFGERYRQYQRRSWRMIPGIW